MLIKKAEHEITAVSAKQYPLGNMPEIAFVGRSNVGKSSLINTMASRKKLARISSEPGKTRVINFYNINDSLYFVDLPGYGFAKVSRSERQKWGRMIEEYLYKSKNLIDVVLLLDIRRIPTDDDKIMYNWIKTYNRRVTLVITKIDKIAKSKYLKQVSMIKDTLNVSDDDALILFSSLTRYGRDELWRNFDELISMKVEHS
ncbi:MAG: ribosome biogenesis GTP-binding protein YihA/YsxC [Clostridiales bacterium]|nr:ribosome biogenesis GTP-binding protein YihA/YsxC [Clostridiales bacterium]